MSVGTEVDKVDLFGSVCNYFVGQAQEGLVLQAEAVVKTAYDSMPVHGRKEGDPDYAVAPAGSPPYSHTETLRDALDFAIRDGYVYVGTVYSKVGVRGAVLEFAAREDSGPGRRNQKRASRASGRKYKPHPFIGPAFNVQLDRFAPRVAGKDSFAPPAEGGFTS